VPAARCRVAAVRSAASRPALQQAAALDVVGARMAAIDPATRQAVLARYPRTGFAQQMSEAMRQQAERAPRTRTRLLWRMGFERAIRRSA